MGTNHPVEFKLLKLAMINDIEEMVPAAERAAFVGEIFGLFAQTAPTSLEEIKLAIAKGDVKAVEQQAHRLKGSCLSIGATALAQVCEVLEQAGRDGHIPADAGALLEQMIVLFHATKAELDLRLSSYAA